MVGRHVRPRLGPDGREVWFTAGMAGDFKSLRAVTLDGKERLDRPHAGRDRPGGYQPRWAGASVTRVNSATS